MILVAGIGNIFLGDDAFGCHVARRMSQRFNSPKVRIIDFGIRGFDLAFALAGGYKASIIVDTLARGGDPGTIYVVEPELKGIDREAAVIEAHLMDPVRILALARSMGAEFGKVRIVGCEPETFEPDERNMALSPRVALAVDPAIRVIESIIEEFLPMEAIA